MSNKRRRVFVAITLAGIVFVSAVALVISSVPSRGAPALPTSSESGPAVATVTRGMIRSVVVLDGVVVPTPAVAVVAPANGVLAGLVAVVGDTVRAGDEVARVRLNGSGSVAVVVPSAGRFAAWTVSEGDQVRLGDSLGSIDPRSFLASAVVAPELLYRFYGQPISISVKIDKGPSPFTCPFKSLGAPISGNEVDPSSVPVHLRCSIPNGVRVFPGVRLKLAAVTGESQNALLLPLQAVAGEADRGFVTRVEEEGITSRSDVVLGLTDGLRIQIVKGLNEGDRVAIPPVNGSTLIAP